MQPLTLDEEVGEILLRPSGLVPQIHPSFHHDCNTLDILAK